ncbi:hypothetical protein ELAN111203_14020 [Elizabethkingia anophelis]
MFVLVISFPKIGIFIEHFLLINYIINIYKVLIKNYMQNIIIEI